jgi:hypothetical protein
MDDYECVRGAGARARGARRGFSRPSLCTLCSCHFAMPRLFDFPQGVRAVPNRSRKASGNRPWLEMGVRVTPTSSLRVAGLPPISKSLAESICDSARPSGSRGSGLSGHRKDTSCVDEKSRLNRRQDTCPQCPGNDGGILSGSHWRATHLL